MKMPLGRLWKSTASVFLGDNVIVSHEQGISRFKLNRVDHWAVIGRCLAPVALLNEQAQGGGPLTAAEPAPAVNNRGEGEQLTNLVSGA